jgi:hypothetical protein
MNNVPTKQHKHFSLLAKDDNFMLGKQHLVFVKRITGKRLLCKTHSVDNICEVSLEQMVFHFNPIVEVW